MATQLEPRKPKRGEPQVVAYDEFLEAQVERARGQVRWVDLASALLGLTCLVLGYWFAFVVLDHWLLPRGFGAVGRWIALAGLAVAASGYALVRIGPLLFKRVNPLYAAQVIEHSQPSLKNSLLNLLLLRRSEAPPGRQVMELIEQRAATAIAETPLESVVDRTPVIRLGYVLMALVAVLCVYKLASPKDPLRSVGRLLMPWSGLAPSSRVAIDDVRPGHAVAFYDDRLTVSAQIRGLREGETAEVVYSSADGQLVDQSVALQPKGPRNEGQLPGGATGLRQDIEYFIVAGDARSPVYHVEVVSAPTILVERVEYDYPDYTGLATTSVDRQGDLRALEGTDVTIFAAANRELREAVLEFDTQGARLPLELRGSDRAVARLKLALNADRNGAEHSGYQLRFKDAEGRGNPHRIHHSIEVTPDEPPVVEITKPARDGGELPVNGSLRVDVRAEDPDFALRSVRLVVDHGGREVLDAPLLAEKHAGEFRGGGPIRPTELGLKPGDEIQYWAEARDVKLPQANRAATIKYRLKIVEPASEAQKSSAQEGQAEENAKGDPPTEPQDGQPSEQGAADESPQQDEASSERQPGEQDEESHADEQGGEEQGAGQQGAREQGSGESGGGESSGDSSGEAGQGQPGSQSADGQPREGQESDGEGEGSAGSSGRVDPETQAGDAIERILQDREQQSGGAASQNPSAQQPSDTKQDKPAGEQPGAAAQPGKKQGNQAQPTPGSSEGQPAEPSSSDKQASDKQAPDKPGKDGQPNDGQLQDRDPEDGEPQDGQPKDRAAQSAEAQPQPGQSEEPAEPRDASNGAQSDKPSGRKQQQPAGDKQQGQTTGESSDEEPSPSEGQKSPALGQEQKSGTPGSDPMQEGSSPSGQPQPNPPQQGQPSQKPSDSKESPSGDPQQQGGREGQSASQQPGQKPMGQPQGTGDPSGPQDGQKQPSAEQQPSPEKGAAPQPQPGDSPQGAPQQQPGDGGQSPPSQPKDAQGGQQPNSTAGEGAPQQQSGEAGAGQKAPDNRATADGQKEQRGGEKAPRADRGQEQEQQSDPASSPSTSERQSDSEGGQQGDQSGGGQSGGGQRADKPGHGSSGNNSSAEQGQGASQEQGQGQASNQPGEQSASDQGTQQEGAKQSGAGGQKQSGGQQQPGGNQPGANPSSGERPATDKPADAQPSSNASGEQSAGQSSANSGASGSQSSGSGTNPGGAPNTESQAMPGSAAPPPADPSSGGDDVNLDYARQATDLALDHLRDKLNKPGEEQELLDKLGWTREEAEEFLKRWQKMKQEAAEPQAANGERKNELDERLKRLGLRPKSTRAAAATKPGDQLRNLREGRRSEPPLEYLDQFRAFSEGTAKGAKRP